MRKTDRALRIEAEVNSLTDRQVGELAGLGQGDAKLESCEVFLQQHRGIGAVEQQALHNTFVSCMVRGEQRGVALEDSRFGSDECLDMIADGDSTALARVH